MKGFMRCLSSTGSARTPACPRFSKSWHSALTAGTTRIFSGALSRPLRPALRGTVRHVLALPKLFSTKKLKSNIPPEHSQASPYPLDLIHIFYAKVRQEKQRKAASD